MNSQQNMFKGDPVESIRKLRPRIIKAIKGKKAKEAGLLACIYVDLLIDAKDKAGNEAALPELRERYGGLIHKLKGVENESKTHQGQKGTVPKLAGGDQAG